MDIIQLEPGCTLTATHGTSTSFTPPLNLSKITLVITGEDTPEVEQAVQDNWQQAFTRTGRQITARPAVIFSAKTAPKNSPLILIDDDTDIPSLGLELPPGTDPAKTGILRRAGKEKPDLLRELYFRHSSESRMLPVSLISGGNGDDPGFWWRLKCWWKRNFSCKPRTLSFGEDRLEDRDLPDDFLRLRVISDSSSVRTILEALHNPSPASVSDTGYGSDGSRNEERPPNPAPENEDEAPGDDNVFDE